MGFEVIITKIPWKEILKQAPLLVDAARKMIDAIKKDPPASKITLAKKEDPIAIVQSEIQGLKENEIKQAEIVSNLAVQVQAVSDALKIVSSRLTIFIGISIVSVTVSIALIFYIFMR